MKTWKFLSPTKVRFGIGVTSEVGFFFKKNKIGKILVVTDAGLLKVGIVDKVTKVLDEENLKYEIFDKTEPEPPVDNVYDALAVFREKSCEGCLGLGGGSSMDVAKAVAMAANNGDQFVEYAGIGKVPNKGKPLVLIPTTSGTGSEVSVFSVMTANEAKTVVVDENIAADAAFVDPLLTKSLPPHVTAATGMDALCHHIESFLSVNSFHFCEKICLEGIGTVAKYLRKAVGNPDNLEARYWMSYASMLGGYVMNMTDGAAAIHALAFALGVQYHVPHGLSNSLMLPKTLAAVAPSEHEKIAQIGALFGVKTEGVPPYEVVGKTIEAIERLIDDIRLPKKISEVGATESDLDVLTEKALSQTRVLGHSTFRLTRDEIKQIFKDSL